MPLLFLFQDQTLSHTVQYIIQIEFLAGPNPRDSLCASNFLSSFSHSWILNFGSSICWLEYIFKQFVFSRKVHKNLGFFPQILKCIRMFSFIALLFKNSLAGYKNYGSQILSFNIPFGGHLLLQRDMLVFWR